MADRLLEDVRRSLLDESGPDARAVAGEVHRHGRLLASGDLLNVAERVAAEVLGAGPLQPLLSDPDVTDILVNGPGPVWVDRGRGVERTDVVLADEGAVRRLAQRLAAGCGRRLDDSCPYADARLPDGVRLHAVLPPLALDGTCLSLRVPARRQFALDDLVRRSAVPEEGAALLRGLIEARVAFAITGGTGSGKTTVLATLLATVPPAERLVVVEDAAELRIDHPHVVRLQARAANAEGAGAVELTTLVRQALRMRPDRLVVGEVRGAEVRDLLAALNTGHEGGCSTVHANRAEQLPARLEALAGLAGMPRAALHSQLASAFEAVVHLRRDRDGHRRVDGIGVLVAGADGIVGVEPAVRFDGAAVRRAAGYPRLAERLATR